MAESTEPGVTYRVVQDQPCEKMQAFLSCQARNERGFSACHGCNGDGTRMVEVAVVERPEFADGKCVPGDDGRPEWMPWDDRPISRVWVEVES